MQKVRVSESSRHAIGCSMPPPCYVKGVSWNQSTGRWVISLVQAALVSYSPSSPRSIVIILPCPSLSWDDAAPEPALGHRSCFSPIRAVAPDLQHGSRWPTVVLAFVSCLAMLWMKSRCSLGKWRCSGVCCRLNIAGVTK